MSRFSGVQNIEEKWLKLVSFYGLWYKRMVFEIPNYYTVDGCSTITYKMNNWMFAIL